MRLSAALGAAAALHAVGVSAASADDWKSRSIYQVITDRFAPVSDTAPARTSPLPAVCDPKDQTWCGGTWQSIIDKLDYIKSIGFDAVWISPVSQNIDVQTPYNYAYHGYWVNNPTALNPRFGDESDLLQLSEELHKRDMYLMVDIVVNNIPALAVDTYLSSEKLVADDAFWNSTDLYHPFCWIDYSNATSVEYCWLGDDKLALMDVNTESTYVQTTLQQWIADFVQKYSVDGLRIDAAKHIPGAFWPPFCKAAGVFCIGEVYSDDIGFTSQFQTEGWMDSVLGYPLYFGLQAAFSQISATQNMSSFINMAQKTISSFPNPEYIGNFLENHDLPRFKNITADPRLVLNAMIPQFLFDGMPVVYYGQEQDMSFGNADPYNRAALWEMDGGGYQNTSTAQTMSRLLNIRKSMIDLNMTFNGVSYMDSRSEIISYSDKDVAIRKGPIIMVLTNRGSPPQMASFAINSTGWPRNEAVVDLLSCSEWATGAGGSMSVSYSQEGYGGLPYVFMLVSDARKLNICTDDQLGIVSESEKATANSGAGRVGATFAAAVLVAAAVVCMA